MFTKILEKMLCLKVVLLGRINWESATKEMFS